MKARPAILPFAFSRGPEGREGVEVMSKIQPTLSVDLDTAAAKPAGSVSNDNVAMGVSTPQSGGVTFTVSTTGVVTPVSATAYPGDMITLEKASGASYTQLCAYRNETCCCNELAGVSSGHMAINSSYMITQAAAGHRSE